MNEAPEPLERYRAARATHLATAERWGKLSRTLGNLRGASFAASVIGVGYSLAQSSVVALWAAAGFLVAFLLLVARHSRVIEHQDHAARLAFVNESAEARADGRFSSAIETGLAFFEASHPYAFDLDLVGKGSLFQRLSVAHTHFGKTALAEWLSRFAELDEVAARQAAVRELAPLTAFREAFEAEALALVQKHRQEGVVEGPTPDPEPLLRFIESPVELIGNPALLLLAWLLPAATFGGIAWQIFGTGSFFHWVVPLALAMMLLTRAQGAAAKAFTAVSTTEGAFLRYGRLLDAIERLDCSSPWLVERKARLSESSRPNVKASQTMDRFRALVGWFDVRHNGMIYPFIDALFLWDIHCTAALERWKRDVGGRAREWFRVIGELEAICSLAALHHDEPAANFPELGPGLALSARGLGHPLIRPSARIENDVAAFGPGQGLLVTGSNMSGKSTFLRALGVNSVLAFAGAPTTAEYFSLAPCVLGTSIRISDSLLSGTSHFFAEVKKLAHVVELSRGPVPVFFLMDEVLHGTNSRERQIGARWVLAELLQHGGFGVFTTHDEGLCELPAPLSEQVRQHHFRESVEGGEMTFDYQLRPGPVTSGNALRLMQKVGLNVPLA